MTRTCRAVIGLFALALAGLAGCRSDSTEASDGGSGDAGQSSNACDVTAPPACPSPAPHYADVAPILEQNCVLCHDGTGSTWPLTDYQSVQAWEDLVRSDLLSCAMPPPDAGVPFTHDDRERILAWIACGTKP